MNKFNLKGSDNCVLGRKLCQIRQEAGVSLDEIAKNTKIKKSFLKSLESCSFDELPSEVYIKGFLKSYADYLSIDFSDVLDLYNKEKGVSENRGADNFLENESMKKRIRNRVLSLMALVTPGSLTLVVFLILIICSVFYFFGKIENYSGIPELSITQPKRNHFTKLSSVNLKGFTEKGNRVTINNQVVFVDENGKFEEVIGLQRGFSKFSVRVVNKFNKERVENLRVYADYKISQ